MQDNFFAFAKRATEALETIAAELADITFALGSLTDAVQSREDREFADRAVLAAQRDARDRAVAMAAQRNREG